MKRWALWFVPSAIFILAAPSGDAQVSPGPVPTIEVYAGAEGVTPGGMLRYAVLVHLGAAWHVNSHVPLDEYLIPTVLKLTPPEGIVVRGVVYPQATTITLEETGENLAVYGGSFKIGLVIEVAATLPPGTYAVPGKLEYQACDKRHCLPPASESISLPVHVVPAGTATPPKNTDKLEGIDFESVWTPVELEKKMPAAAVAVGQNWRALADRFVITGTAGYMNAAEFRAFLDEVKSGEPQRRGGLFAGKSTWLILLTVLAGGLLLNVTPCVLPLIPVNLAIIGAGARAGSRCRGFLLGATYGAGMALAYGAVGAAVVMGAAETFGAINATLWFNALIAIVFLTLGLAMFDVIRIDLSRFQARLGPVAGKRGGYITAFVMGVLAALLAGACVAPVVISTLVYAQDLYTRGIGIGLLLPFLLGVGMALPWPFAGAGMAILPRPGKWMERVKCLFGVIILALAVYYAYASYHLFEQRYLVDRDAVRESASQLDAQGWQYSLTEGLAQARQENRPVVIDFWATWCKNCLVMNQTTFKDPEVVRRLEPYVKIKFQAEDPSDPATAEVMKYYGVVGMPTIVTLHPKPQTQARGA